MLELPLTEQLVFIEAPTGSGKTEAAVIWADRLVAAGLVDGMYFAVPTRSAATELHYRISTITGRLHPSLLGRVVRAVPGMLDVDRPSGIWDEPTMLTWALGSTRRVMSAPIAVGTIDQAMLSQLRTRHSWLRAWCLARQLLVIDEVHASDPYMSEIIACVVEEHLLSGGYALLMSATLGENGRRLLKIDFCADNTPVSKLGFGFGERGDRDTAVFLSLGQPSGDSDLAAWPFDRYPAHL